MANLMGKQFRFQWSTGPAVHQTLAHVVGVEGDIKVHDATLPGDVHVRKDVSINDGRLFVRTFVGSAGLSSKAPPIPNGTYGTATIDLDHYPSGTATQTYTVKGVMLRIQWRGQSIGGGPPQTADYVFEITPHPSDAAGTDPWTVA